MGISLFFWLVDINLYPTYKFQFLVGRVAVFLYFSVMLFFIPRIGDKKLVFFMMLGLFLTCLALSTFSYIAGDGFRSTYFIGIIQIMMVSSIFVRYSLKQYITFIALVLTEHFSLNALIPVETKYIMMQVFGLGGTAFVAIVIHKILYDLLQEVRTLEGLVPICSSCKRVRDDKGFWHGVEKYIKECTQVEFTHGLCPDCLEDFKREARRKG